MANNSTLSARERMMKRTEEALRQAHQVEGPEREELLQEVVRWNVPVAHSIAHQFHNRGEPAEDIDQVACLGLTKAVRGFDPDREKRFLAYAVPTIRGEVKRYFRDGAWLVRPGRRIQELQAEISPAIADLSQQLGRSPRSREIAAYLGREPEQIDEALACRGCFAPDSLDDRGSGDDGFALSDRLGTVEEGFAHSEAVTMLGSACRALKPRDRRILYLRFYKQWTQAEIAADLGVTQMQVSRLLSRILSDLRTSIDEVPAGLSA